MNAIACAALAVLVAAGSAQATTIYDEVVSGDAAVGEAVSIVAGDNVIRGSGFFAGSGTDDRFDFTLPAGFEITGLTFMASGSAPPTLNRADLVVLLEETGGGPSLQTGFINVSSSFSQTVGPDASRSADALPFGPGDYTLGIRQSHGGSLSGSSTVSYDYEITLTTAGPAPIATPPATSDVPLPAAAPLLALGLGALGVAARRRRGSQA